ncbi:hypothetical protein Tco_0834976, partial [Tanacetum coccineum]
CSGTQDANSDTGTGLVMKSDGIVTATKVVSPSVVDKTMAKEKQSSLVDITVLGSSSYVKAMNELRTDVDLKDNIMAAMLKITRDGYYTCNICVEYEWKPPLCACRKVFGHVQEECPKNVGAGETKKPSQTPKGFPVGQKMGFKPKQVYQPVSKKPTANISRNKNKNVEPTKEVHSSGSSFWNVNYSSPSTTPVIKKIDKIEKLIINGKVTLVDDEGKPLEKVDYSGDYDSEDEFASVDNEMASFLAKKDGYGTQSLLEQWKVSYENGDYKYDPYDDDMYEGLDIPDKLQAICDNLDIKTDLVDPADHVDLADPYSIALNNNGQILMLWKWVKNKAGLCQKSTAPSLDSHETRVKPKELGEFD